MPHPSALVPALLLAVLFGTELSTAGGSLADDEARLFDCLHFARRCDGPTMQPPDSATFGGASQFWRDIQALIASFDARSFVLASDGGHSHGRGSGNGSGSGRSSDHGNGTALPPCPKVYVYDFPASRGTGKPSLSDYDHKKATASQAFGDLVVTSDFATSDLVSRCRCNPTSAIHTQKSSSPPYNPR